jgi:hypothetical protein
VTEPAHRPAMNPAVGYEGFEKMFSRLEPSLRATAPAVLGYHAEAVAGRLAQRVVELALHPSMRAAALRLEAGRDPFPQAEAVEEHGGLRFGPERIAITPRAWLRCSGEFFLQWLRAFAVMGRAFAAPRKVPVPLPATLLFGVGAEDMVVEDSDARFVEFCRKGPLPLLDGARHLIAERAAPFVSTEPELLTYTRYPLFEAARLRRPGLADLARFLLTQLLAAAAFIRLAVMQPVGAILARDLAFHALAADLDRRGLLHAVFITNSHYHVQPLWLRSLPGRRFTSHMAWYSQNSIPFCYARDRMQAYLPNHRHIALDHIWVWTPGYAKYLRERGARGAIHVVGPILWYLPPAKVQPASRLRIAVFDVTPQVRSLTMSVGLSYNYYRASNVAQFIRDLVDARDAVQGEMGEPIEMVLKHKRTPSAHHDPGYVTLIHGLEKEGRLTLVPPQVSVYELIGAAALVVVMPYSSPAYVAAAMRVPSIYYDPEGELIPSFEAGEGIGFAAGPEALRPAIARALARRMISPQAQARSSWPASS